MLLAVTAEFRAFTEKSGTIGGVNRLYNFGVVIPLRGAALFLQEVSFGLYRPSKIGSLRAIIYENRHEFLVHSVKLWCSVCNS